MTLTLDTATEKRIQREIDLGQYTEPKEVIAHALALLTGEDQTLQLASKVPNEGALDEAFGLWSNRHEDGLAYQERMRTELLRHSVVHSFVTGV